MISDVLHDAISKIRRYQRDMSGYDSNKYHIEYVKREMARLMLYFDASPSTHQIFARLEHDSEPTTDKEVREHVDRYLEEAEARDKMADDAVAEIGLTSEDFANPNSSPEVARKIKIYYCYTMGNLATVAEATAKVDGKVKS